MCKYTIEENELGRWMVIHGPWYDGYRDIMREYNINSLHLNNARGWHGDSIEFIKKIDFLEGCRIIATNVKDVSPVFNLQKLKYLAINCPQDHYIDYSCFPFLEKCSINWSAGTRDVRKAAESLKKLFIYKYSDKDFDALAPLVNLEKLEIKVGNARDTDGLKHLTKLQDLELYLFTRLTDLNGIRNLLGLKKFVLDTCRKINDIDIISSHVGIEELFVNNMGDIASLKPIEHLLELKKLLFIESTNIIDGDMSVLLRLPNLQYIAYQNRKHYNYKSHEIRHILDANN